MENIFSLLFVGHIFLLLSMPSYFILDGVHSNVLCCGGSGCHCLPLKSVDGGGVACIKVTCETSRSFKARVKLFKVGSTLVQLLGYVLIRVLTKCPRFTVRFSHSGCSESQCLPTMDEFWTMFMLQITDSSLPCSVEFYHCTCTP